MRLGLASRHCRLGRDGCLLPARSFDLLQEPVRPLPPKRSAGVRDGAAALYSRALPDLISDKPMTEEQRGPTSSRRARRKVRLIWHLALAVA